MTQISCHFYTIFFQDEQCILLTPNAFVMPNGIICHQAAKPINQMKPGIQYSGKDKHIWACDANADGTIISNGQDSPHCFLSENAPERKGKSSSVVISETIQESPRLYIAQNSPEQMMATSVVM